MSMSMLMMPCPCHIASPWQSKPRVWAPDVWVLAQSSNCLLMTQGSPSRHEGLTRWAYILTLVGLTGWTGSQWKSRRALGRGAPLGSGESQKSELACLRFRHLFCLLVQTQDLYSSGECPGLLRLWWEKKCQNGCALLRSRKWRLGLEQLNAERSVGILTLDPFFCFLKTFIKTEVQFIYNIVLVSGGVVQLLSYFQLFCDSTDCSLPGSSVSRISQVGTLEWGAISFSRGSSQPRD